MPFGRYSGERLSAIPANYLDWLLSTVRLGSCLRAAVTGEITRRGIVRPCNHPCDWEERE